MKLIFESRPVDGSVRILNGSTALKSECITPVMINQSDIQRVYLPRSSFCILRCVMNTVEDEDVKEFQDTSELAASLISIG